METQNMIWAKGSNIIPYILFIPIFLFRWFDALGDFCMVLWEDQNGCSIQDYANYRALGDFSIAY